LKYCLYLIRGFFCGTGAGIPHNNGAVSSAGFLFKKNMNRKRGGKKIVRAASIP
jgi:hypothetical protein